MRRLCVHVVMVAVALAPRKDAIVLLEIMRPGRELVDILELAVSDAGVDRDVAPLDEVAEHRDGAEQILVVRARRALLADDGDDAVATAVVVDVPVLDRLHLGGMAGDLDLVALAAMEVGDRVLPEGVDPSGRARRRSRR